MRLEPGQVVDDRYRLEGRLGSGGMADVWLAHDAMLDRPVALKFLHERFNQDQQFVERFRREASSAAGLQHPNVVGVYDRGEWDGRHFIAMEYVEGASLKDLIAQGLSVGEAVEITRQILAGARYAHERGIVHRDLKPQNVLVDSEGRARVADFGIAKAGASEITQTGSVLGTAQYLSPEQAQGQAVTAASDLYSIGVILYEALTGAVPFDAETPVAIALKQISERPRPPSALNPNVPPSLDAVVLRALAKDPANRFPSAAEFLRALDAAEADPSGAALGDTAAYAPVAAGAAAGAGLAGVAAAEQAAAAERAGAAEQEDEERRRWRLIAVIAAILLLALGAVLAWALTRPGQARVPAVIGEPVGQARTILERAGFDVGTDRLPNCSRPGTVQEQDPAAGRQADEGSTVTLTVSAGQRVRVPKLRGSSVADASKRLKRRQLHPDEKTAFNKRVRPGDVIATEPPAGESVACGSRVTVLVSRGQDLVVLPDVVGMEEADARSRLEARDFLVNVEEKSSALPAGQVIGEDPGPGSRLPRGSEVKLTVSSGPATASVPNVVGQRQDAAAASLEAAGFSVRVVIQSTDDKHQDGRVLNQSPSAGTTLEQGQAVTIFVGEFTPPPPTTTTTSTTSTTSTTTP